MTLRKKSYPKYYRSIENLPQWNFDKILNTDDLRYLLVLDDYFDMDSVAIPKTLDLNAVWIKIFDEYIQTFGLSEAFQKKQRQKIKIAKLKLEMVLKENWGIEAIIRNEEKKLESESEGNDITMEELTAHIEKSRKMPIDIMKVSVKMFNTYLAIMKKENKKK